MEESLTLEELLELYESAMERQDRLLRTFASAFASEPLPESPFEQRKQERLDRIQGKTPTKGGFVDDGIHPALIDPKKGGKSKALKGEKEVAMLPFGLGYSKMDEE